jgi:eukaryotic-like serine/threonine-protein kinase
LSLDPGARLGPYEVLDRLGSGGMGEIYRASDSRLGREVALKVLPQEVTTDPLVAARFAQEARSASALNHPNIVTIYDIGKEGEVNFIAMELVDGRTLRELLRDGPLAQSRAVQLAVQLADGLTAAHERGVIHRDIKPENLMVTPEWQLKILDFGLAKALGPISADPTTLRVSDSPTSPGSVLGTVGYMSPEQVRGRLADARSDLFALGCVLYEMLVGRRAFKAASPVETMAAILNREPDLSPSGRELPPELTRLIQRCLEKDPHARPRSARAVAEELRAVSSSPGSAPRTTTAESSRASEIRRTPRPTGMLDSIAVIPFANAGAEEGTEYLSDGVTEQLINSLSRIPTLRVIPRSTMFRYKAPDVDPLAVGRGLGARLVLTGRVLQRGESLNVQAELVDVGEEAQVWGEQYVRHVDDLFTVQTQIASQIADKLRVTLTGEQRDELQRQQTEDGEAYRLYLKGRYFWNKRTAEGLQKAVGLLRAAIERDPLYALAWAGLADAYNNLGSYCVVPPAEAFPKAKAAATRALELDATRAEPHIAMAFALQYFDWDWAAAEREYGIGISLGERYATAHHWFGWYLICQGRFEEAERSMRKALSLDPLSLPITTNIGFCHHFARQPQAAIEQFRRALEMGPEFAEAHRGLGEATEQLGDLEAAVDHYRRALRFSGGSTEVMGALGRVLARSGAREEALGHLGELERLGRERYVSTHEKAAILIGLGQTDEALGWLARGIEERSYKMVYLNVDPDLDPLRGDARFAELLRQVALAG